MAHYLNSTSGQEDARARHLLHSQSTHLSCMTSQLIDLTASPRNRSMLIPRPLPLRNLGVKKALSLPVRLLLHHEGVPLPVRLISDSPITYLCLYSLATSPPLQQDTGTTLFKSTQFTDFSHNNYDLNPTVSFPPSSAAYIPEITQNRMQ